MDMNVSRQSAASPAPRRPQAPPRSATRIPQILRVVAEAKDGVSLAQLSGAVRTPKSSLLALVRALVAAGFLDHREGRYRIGGEAVNLASSIVARRAFPNVALPVVDALAESTGESAFLAELAADGESIVFIYKADSKNALRFMAEVGSREFLYSSSVGRAILAFKPKEWSEAYLRAVKLAPVTAKTVRTKKDLRRLLDGIRRDRTSLSLEETIDGVVGIAAPIFDKSGQVIAGVVIGAPISRAAPKLKALERQVAEAGVEISRLMGYGSGPA